MLRRLFCIGRLLAVAAGAVFWAGLSAIAAEAPKPAPLPAVQTIYREGVPHTDARGNLRMQYDPAQSFFQLGIWGNPIGTVYGHDYDLKVLTDAGFNTMWPWPGWGPEAALRAAEAHKLQVVLMGALSEADAARWKDHPRWLGNVWHDEPTGSFWGQNMQAKFDEFVAYKRRLNAAAPGRAVFVNDVPWISPPATPWWTKWNTAGDVACHDNYPILDRQRRARSLGGDSMENGIDRTVGLAAEVNRQKKPVWLIVGAFRVQDAGSFPFRFPTPMQLRAEVYAGLVHGATGIVYFCWDTYVCRDGRVVGMSPDPKVQYLEPGPGRPKPSPALPMDLAAGKALWMAATQINREVRELTPSLLSPTVDNVAFTVAAKGESPSAHPVRCLLKPHRDGGYVLLTVNLEDAVLDVTFTFPAALASVQPMFENRDSLARSPEGRTLTDRYEPFDVHVYRILPGKAATGKRP